MRSRLDAAGVRPDTYDIDGGSCEECLRLERVTDGWVVYYAERGLRTGEHHFNNGSDAFHYFADRLINDPTAQHTEGDSPAR